MNKIHIALDFMNRNQAEISVSCQNTAVVWSEISFGLPWIFHINKKYN